MILRGILLPLLIAAYAAGIWITEETTWIGSGTDVKVKGETARSLAVCYFAAASFAHFRWFWGLRPCYGIFEIGTVLSLLAGLGGFGAALYYAFRDGGGEPGERGCRALSST